MLQVLVINRAKIIIFILVCKASIATYSPPHPHPTPRPLLVEARPRGPPTDGILRPTSLEPAFQLHRPGEYEVHDVLVNGVRTYRDEARGSERGDNVAFVYQLDGLPTVPPGDIGHTLT